MIFILFLALYIFLVAKGFKFKILARIPYRIPLTFKEKEMIKNYYSTKNLTAIFTDYSFRMLNNILPLFLISLFFIDHGWLFYSLLLFGAINMNI